MSEWLLRLLPPEKREPCLQKKKGGKKRVARGESLNDAASGTDGNVLNGGGNDYSESAPLGQIDQMLSGVGEEIPMLEPEEETIETKAAVADEENEEENDPAAQAELPTAELPKGFYIVEAIRAKRVWNGRKQYQIKWLGWPEETNTWEPMKNLSQVSDMIEDFEGSLISREQRKQKRKKAIHSTSSRGKEKRNCGSVRRSIRKPRGSEADDAQRISNIHVAAVEPLEDPVSEAADSQRITNIPVAAVEDAKAVAATNAGNNDHNNQGVEVSDNLAIIEIIRRDSYEPAPTDTECPTLKFLAKRVDGAEVIVTNRYLKAHNPLLLANYYEQYVDMTSLE